MTYHTNQGSYSNGYYVPNMRAHQDSFIVPQINQAIFKPIDRHGTPEMPARTYEPIKIEPVRFEPVKFEPVKFEPIKIEPFKFEPIKIDPFKFNF